MDTFGYPAVIKTKADSIWLCMNKGIAENHLFIDKLSGKDFVVLSIELCSDN